MSIDQQRALSQFDPLEAGAGPSPELWSRQSASVRDLIAELARIEDAVRRTPTFLRPTDGQAAVNPALLELLELLAREGRVVRTLRGYRRILDDQVGTGPDGRRRTGDGPW